MQKMFILAAVALMASGCASVMTAETQSINVTTSSNKQAEVAVTNRLKLQLMTKQLPLLVWLSF